MVSATIGITVGPFQLPTSDLAAQVDRFENGTASLSAAPDVVDGSTKRVLVKMPECTDEVGAMDIIPNLFALVAKHCVRVLTDCTLRQVREEAVELGTGVPGTGETPTAKAGGLHPEISPIFLNQQVRCRLRHAEEAMGRVVNAHRLVDPVFVKRMRCLNLPPSLKLHQRQEVWGVAVHLVRGGVDEDR